MKIPKIFGLPPPSIQLPTPVGRNLAPVNMIKYPIIHKYIIYRVSYLSGGAGFLLSTVFLMTILVVFFAEQKRHFFAILPNTFFWGGHCGTDGRSCAAADFPKVEFRIKMTS